MMLLSPPLIVLLYLIASNSILRIKNVSKFYNLQSIFNFGSSQPFITAFRNVTLDLNAFTTVIGSSGSGKSTFAKCVGGLELFSYGELLFDDNNSTHSWRNSAYLGLQYRSKYNEQSLCKSHIQSFSYQPANVALDIARSVLDIPSILDKRPDSLLESQRHLFNIYLGLQNACEYHINQLLKLGLSTNELSQHTTTITTTSSSSSINIRTDDSSDSMSTILILDEYLDKLSLKVRNNVINKLKQYIQLLENHNKNNNTSNTNIHKHYCYIIVITHRESVLVASDSRSIILHNGRLYDVKDDYKKLIRPVQLQLLE